MPVLQAVQQIDSAFGYLSIAAAAARDGHLAPSDRD